MKDMNSTIPPPVIVNSRTDWALGISPNLGERKLWICTSCRPGEGWAPPGYSYSRHAT